MWTGRDRRDEPAGGAKSDAGTPAPAEARLPYDAPRLTVYGSLVELTQKRGGPGRDNPHFKRSF